MTFLSGAFLLALPLAAIPVLIHLYRGRQRDVVLWGAMQFLTAAVTQGRRMERLEELLLMLVRLAVVVALVLALARPLVQSSWLGHRAESEMILVLDNSLSMSREVAGERPAGLMQARALELVDSLSDMDNVKLIAAVGNEWLTADSIRADAIGKRQLRELVGGVEPTLGSADLLAALQTSVHLEAEDDYSSRHIVVLTDDQASSWHADAASAWRQLAASIEAAPRPTSLEVVDCGLGASEIDNLAVAEVVAERFQAQPDQPLEVTALIHNSGNVARDQTEVEWLVAGRVVERGQVPPLVPGAQQRIGTTLRLQEAGPTLVTCRLVATDQVPLDQENSVVVEVADQLPVLFVRGDEDDPSSRPSAAQLFAAALGDTSESPGAWNSIFSLDVVGSGALVERSLGDYRAVVINSLEHLERETLDRLETFVRAGGGLWIALGDQMDANAFNRDWFSDGAGLSPAGLASLELASGDEAFELVHPPSADHAPTAQLANTTRLDIDRARIRQRWQFEVRKTAETSVSVLLKSGTGDPLVVENHVGQGRILVQTFPLGMDWSNLPLLKAYVVIVHDWLHYITAPSSARFNLRPGGALVARAPPEAEGIAKVEVITPQGRTVELLAIAPGRSAPIRYAPARHPGVYRLRVRDGADVLAEFPFYVQRDASESDLTAIGVAGRRQLASACGVPLDGTKAVPSAIAQMVPRHQPIWDLLLVGLICFLAGELLLSSLLSRRRQVYAVSTV